MPPPSSPPPPHTAAARAFAIDVVVANVCSFLHLWAQVRGLGLVTQQTLAVAKRHGQLQAGHWWPNARDSGWLSIANATADVSHADVIDKFPFHSVRRVDLSTRACLPALAQHVSERKGEPLVMPHLEVWHMNFFDEDTVGSLQMFNDLLHSRQLVLPALKRVSQGDERFCCGPRSGSHSTRCVKDAAPIIFTEASCRDFTHVPQNMLCDLETLEGPLENWQPCFDWSRATLQSITVTTPHAPWTGFDTSAPWPKLTTLRGVWLREVPEPIRAPLLRTLCVTIPASNEAYDFLSFTLREVVPESTDLTTLTVHVVESNGSWLTADDRVHLARTCAFDALTAVTDLRLQFDEWQCCDTWNFPPQLRRLRLASPKSRSWSITWEECEARAASPLGPWSRPVRCDELVELELVKCFQGLLGLRTPKLERLRIDITSYWEGNDGDGVSTPFEERMRDWFEEHAAQSGGRLAHVQVRSMFLPVWVRPYVTDWEAPNLDHGADAFARQVAQAPQLHTVWANSELDAGWLRAALVQFLPRVVSCIVLQTDEKSARDSWAFANTNFLGRRRPALIRHSPSSI